MELLLLEKLIIYSATWCDTVSLLSNMSFPSLRSFEISSPHDLPILPDLPALLLRANGRNITRLALTEFKNERGEEFYLDALRNMPLLQDVEIEFWQSSDPIYGGFFANLLGISAEEDTSSTMSQCILPRLERFTFVGPIQVNAFETAGSPPVEELQFDKVLLEVLQGRRTLVVEPDSNKRLLRFCEIKTESSLDQPQSDAIKGLQKLVGGGLSLSVVVGGKPWL